MKRNPKSIPAFLLALVLAVSLVLPVGAAGSGITLDKTSATLAVGQTLTLTATLPEGGQTRPSPGPPPTRPSPPWCPLPRASPPTPPSSGA